MKGDATTASPFFVLKKTKKMTKKLFVKNFVYIQKICKFAE